MRLAALVGAAATVCLATAEARAQSPYPPSEVVRDVTFAPVDEIECAAAGSDNWPVTWADDGDLYTSYGDGWGFDPGTDEKLSLGFARVAGAGDDFTGTNIRSVSGERTGDGAAGEKASGMLMVDGTLYMLVRNAGNAALWSSVDHAVSWEVASWRFTTSFGAPTFLNFGSNYEGHRDGYVYVYSQDGPSAYEVYDGAVLARAPLDAIADRGAYEFFVSLDGDGAPVWTSDVEGRGSVLDHPGRSYRMDVAYVEPLDRYFVLQSFGRENDGWAMYDGPEPWGPWTTVFFTTDWDLDVNVHGLRLPTKWISSDGRTMYLLFSGRDAYDAFCVRRLDLTLAGTAPDGDADADADGGGDSDGSADGDVDGPDGAGTDADRPAVADSGGDGGASPDGGNGRGEAGCHCAAARRSGPSELALVVALVAAAAMLRRKR